MSKPATNKPEKAATKGDAAKTQKKASTSAAAPAAAAAGKYAIGAADIQAAEKRTRQYIHTTPMMTCSTIDQMANAGVRLATCCAGEWEC
jgi:hypothetical protein